MKRLLPAPLMTTALFVTWLVLHESLAPGTVLVALIVGVAVPWLFEPLRPEHLRIRSLRPLPRFLAHVAFDLVASNLRMARDVMLGRTPRRAFVKVPLELREPTGLALLAVVATIVPGTVWSELSRDNSLLLVHVWDLDEGSEATFALHFKNRYEKPLMEIFR